MKLIDFLNALPVEARDSFAARCETSFDYLRQVGYGNRPCNPALAINLERESARVLLCEVLCPAADWAFIRASRLPSAFASQAEVTEVSAAKQSISS